MTKSTITREQLLEIIETDHVQCGEASYLARMALAAMDSEPVIVVGDDGGDALSYRRLIQSFEPGTKLYRHAQPAPASEPVYQYWCYTTVENSEGDPEEFWFWKDCEKDFYDRWKNAKRTLYKTPQPALVVPPEQHWEELCRQHPDMSIGDAIIRDAWWNHCRAAMLQENPVCTCPSGDGSLRWPCQVHPGSSPVIPDGSASMLRRWLAFGRGMQNAGSQLPHNLIAETESMLAVAPQPQNAPQNIPEIIPGWIPVSEQKPDCWCLTCRPVVLNDMRFVVCPDCGNKRCPRANDHRNACTGSNEPGQEGNAYPDTPREVKP
ncbi:hypothetical protein [Klebsiella pneumoniae]|uniref:hypothetical protein n=1 Tax=Klebsiella pneumoniae TaxID=573 RepID=UPI003528D760